MTKTTNPDVTEPAVARLKKIAGQVTGIQRMVTENRPCVDVLQQIAAAQAALMKTGRVILAAHVERSLAAALSREAPERQKAIDELVHMFSRFCVIEGSAAPPANPRGNR